MDNKININTSKCLNTIICVLILLWPCIIGPEVLLESKETGLPVTETQKPIAKPGKLPDTYPLKQKQQVPAAQIDEDQFLRSFKRQAQGTLKLCLAQRYPNQKHIIFQAMLLKQGRLTKIQTPLESESPANCAIAVIKEMSFQSMTENLLESAVQVSWRVDW